MRWLTVRLEFFGNLMVSFVALFVALSGNTVSSSTVCLSISCALNSNLDLLGKHSDLELWEVLELYDLKDFVQSLPKKLLHEMSEGGENLRVPVMDAGRILEYDTPQNLLQRKGAFSEMVAEVGIRR